MDKEEKEILDDIRTLLRSIRAVVMWAFWLSLLFGGLVQWNNL